MRRMDFLSSSSSATKMSRFTTVPGGNGVTRSATRSLHERRPTLGDLAQVSRHRAMFRSPFGHGHRPGERTRLESLPLSVNGVLHVVNHAARDVKRRSRVSRLDLGRTGPVSGAAPFGFLAAMVVLAACFKSSTNEFPDATPSPALSDGASGTPGINVGRLGYRQPGALLPTLTITGIENWLNGEPTTIAKEAAKDNVVLMISGPTPASTASGRFPGFGAGTTSTAITVS
mgnify:CR=1 FL=1